MAIDNVLLLLLVPWAGAASDRASASGRGRLAIWSSQVSCWRRPAWRSSCRRVVAGTSGLIAVDDRALHRHQSAAVALSGARGRPGAVALSIVGDWIGDVPDVRWRDRLPDARADAWHAARRFSLQRAPCSSLRQPFAVSLREPSAIASTRREATFRSLSRCGMVRRAWRGPGHARDLPRIAAAAVDLSNVHDVVLAAWHRTLRRPRRRCRRSA